MSDTPPPVVTVARSDYRVTDRRQRDLYLNTRAILRGAVTTFGPELAISTVMSAIGRELRQHIGVENTKSLFRQFAETMDEAAQHDELPS